jgi:hypothetical protein
MLVVFFLGNEENEAVTSQRKQQLNRDKALSSKAFAFLEPRKAECAKNPFELPTKMMESLKPKHVEPPPPKKKPEPPVVKEPVKPEPEPEPVREPIVVAEEKKPEPKVLPGTFEFMFQNSNNDGRTIAVVRAQPQGGELQVFTVGVGEVLLGVKVISISDDRIGLQDARGRKGTIPLGNKRNVWYLIDNQ